MSRLPVGGVENQLVSVLRKYDRKRLTPLVCSLSDKGEIGKEIEDMGVEIFCLNKLKHKFDWTIVKDLYSFIKQKDIKIVRTHQYHANFYGRLAARIANVPCIVASVHNIYTRDRKIHRRIINRFLAGSTDKIIAVSESVKKDLLKYDGIPGVKVKVICNGVDINKFASIKETRIREELGIPPEFTVIGTIGRLTLQKGQKYLLEAVSKLKDSNHKFVLLIAGDGILKTELQNYSRELGIYDSVRFLGTRRDVPEILSAIDIFVLPSLWEGLGNALIEAMASGKAIITTDIPPIREVVNSEKVGILVPVKNSGAIASAIKLLLHDQALARRIGRAAMEKVSLSFNIDNTVNSYENLFEDILKSKKWNI